MLQHPPLLVAMLHCDEDDIDYQLYTEAYGLEMQIDDEWNVEAVLLAPHDHLAAVTENTEVTGEDTAIVSAGVTDVPVSDDGTPDLSAISDPRNNWLLVGDPRRNEADDVINTKLRAALDAGCRPILCVTDSATQLLAPLGAIDCSSIVFAFVHSNATVPDVAANMAKSIRDHLATIEATGNPRFIVAGDISVENASELVALDGVDGLFLMDDKYDDFADILELLETLGG